MNIDSCFLRAVVWEIDVGMAQYFQPVSDGAQPWTPCNTVETVAPLPAVQSSLSSVE